MDYQVDSLEKLEFMPGVFRNLYKLRSFTDYELVVVSNQDGMGSDSFPEADFRAPHEKFLEAFRNEGVEFDDLGLVLSASGQLAGWDIGDIGCCYIAPCRQCSK